MREDLAGTSNPDSTTEVSSYKPSQLAGSFTLQHDEEGTESLESCRNGEFFWPPMTLAHRLDAISQGPKNSRFPGPKTITQGPYKS